MSVASHVIFSNFFFWKLVNSKPPTILFDIVVCTCSDNLSRNSCIWSRFDSKIKDKPTLQSFKSSIRRINLVNDPALVCIFFPTVSKKSRKTIQRSSLCGALRTPWGYRRSWTVELTGVASGGSGATGVGTGTISGCSATGISRTVPTTLDRGLSWIGAGGVLATSGWLTSTVSVSVTSTVCSTGLQLVDMSICRFVPPAPRTLADLYCLQSALDATSDPLDNLVTSPSHQPLTDDAVYPSHSRPWCSTGAVG